MLCFLSLLLVPIAVFETYPTANGQSEIEIPTWVKNNAGWFAEDQISKSDYLYSMAFLIALKFPQSGLSISSTDAICRNRF